jgi:hypothetical protein
MANALQLRRGTTTQHSTFTGLAGEVTVDTTKDTVVVHDGATAGGIPLATEDSVSAANLLTAIKTVDGAGSGLDADLLDGQTGTYYTNYADTAVSNLVASAPSTLDTLNELAAALGDDPNFATTVTNSIATKMPLAGGTFTGAVGFGDNVKAIFGASNDLEIYCDGANSVIQDTSSGAMIIKGSSLSLQNQGGTQFYLQSTDGGSTRLYYAGADKIATTSNGIDVTGNINADSITLNDNAPAYFGTGNDLQIYHDGSNSWINELGTGNLRIKGQQIDILTGSGDNAAYFETNGTARLYYDNAIKIATTSTGIDVTGNVVADGCVVDGTLDIEEVFEKVTTNTTTSGTYSEAVTGGGVYYLTNNQTANRTINFTSVNSSLGIGKSVTVSVLATQGSTAYYFNAYQVDGSSVTPKWSGGSAPSGGNASGIDVYTFTIIKTANATFTVLASVTQYA